MIKESTQPTRIVTADLKCIPLLVASIAFPLHTCDGSHHSISYPWIFSHFHITPLNCFGCFMIFSRLNDLPPMVFRRKLLRTPINPS